MRLVGLIPIPVSRVAHMGVAIALLAIGFIALSYFLKRHRGVESFIYNFTREIGIALLIASVGIGVIDWRMAIYHEQDREAIVSYFAGLTLPSMLEGATGKTLAKEIKRQLIDPPYIYSNYNVEGRFDYPDGADRDSLFGQLTTTFDVSNRSLTPGEYTIMQKLSDVRRGQSIAFQRIAFHELDDKGRYTSSLVEDNESALRSIMTWIGPTSVQWLIPVTIKPGHKYQVLIQKTIGFRVPDEFSVRTRYCCDGMRVKLWFPPDITTSTDFYYPTDAGVDTMSAHIGSEVIASIGGPVLPYQGLYLSWMRISKHSRGGSPVARHRGRRRRR